MEDVPAAELLDTAGRRFGAGPAQPGGRSTIESDGTLLVRADRPPGRSGAGQPGRERAALRQRATSCCGAPRRAARWSCTCATAVTASPTEFIGQAFERFARADHARSRGGAGLGLAIVAAIADAHGGSAGARNVPGGGADVWITLPVGSAA